jgi:hypothetical protein
LEHQVLAMGQVVAEEEMEEEPFLVEMAQLELL